LGREITIENINILYNFDQDYKIGQGGFGQVNNKFNNNIKITI